MKFKQVMGWIYLLVFGGVLIWKFNDALYGLKDAWFIIFIAVVLMILVVLAIRKILHH